MFHTVSRSRVTLPRLSIAGLMLAFVLSATVATAVGVAAWSLGTSAGPSADAIRKAAYQQGMAAGEARGRTAAALRVRNHAYAKGRSVGYRIGLHKGIHRGKAHALTMGRAEGYRSGYTAGVARGRLEGAAASGKHTKHPKN
jgi:hypothetical protein